MRLPPILSNYFFLLGAAVRGNTRMHTYDHVPDQSQVYLQMPGNLILSGVLHNIGLQVPSWVVPPHPAHDNANLVYVRMANGRGLSAALTEVVHHGNDTTVDRFRSYIRVTNNLIYTANLQPYSHEVHFSSSPRIFLRIPYPNNLIYTGMLHRENSLPANLIIH